MSFSALPVDKIDFGYLQHGIEYYSAMIKLRLGFIHAHRGKSVSIADFESVFLQARKIIENFAHYYTFLFQHTTDATLSTKKALGEYNAEQIIKYMMSSGYVTLIAPFGNDAALTKAVTRCWVLDSIKLYTVGWVSGFMSRQKWKNESLIPRNSLMSFMPA